MASSQEPPAEVKQRESDMRWLLSQPQGRRLLWSLIQQCGVDRISYTGNSETFWREGQRSIGVQLAADAKALAPDLYKQMVIENL